MTKAFRISLATATLFTFGLAVTATPAAAQGVGGVGVGITIPNGPLAGAVVGGSGTPTVQGGGGSGGFISGPTTSFNPTSSVSAPQLPTQASTTASAVGIFSGGSTAITPFSAGSLPGGGGGGFSLPSGGAGVGGGSN